MDFLTSHPLFLYLLGAVALYFLYQRFAPQLRIRTPALNASPQDLLDRILGPSWAARKLERAVARQKKAGNFLAAGKLLEEAGRPAEAAEAYVQGQENWAAAATLEKLGRTERAAELFLAAGDHKKAAQMLIDAGKPAKAAVLFMEKGNTLEAARLFALAGDFGRAADLYARAGYPLRAAENYEKKGDYLKAAECHEKHFMENVSYSTTYTSTAPSADQRSAHHAGRLYEQAGELERALVAYQKGSYFKEAASVCMKLGQFPKAAELYMRGEEPTLAAHAHEKAGDEVAAANLLGEVALKDERLADAARYFLKGQDYLRSAELFEQIGMPNEAAGAYEAGESWAAAGAVYIRAGRKDKAAASYERARDYETAARLYEEAGQAKRAVELYEKAGFTFKSGEAAAAAGERDRAIALLQKVPPGDENYGAATELLARLFIDSRMPGLALERVQKTIAGEPVSPNNLGLYYWLAAAYEASGKGAEAMATYKKVQAEDLHFRDVDARVARLSAGGPRDTGGTPRAAVLRELHERGIATLQVCPSCGRCYDHRAQTCAEDRSRLAAPRIVPLVLGERYRLVRVLGEGGMGIVFEAHDQRLDRRVAVKIVNAEEFRDGTMRERLDREARAVARIRHPGVVGMYDSGQLDDGSAFLVMELLEGHDLASLLKAYGAGRPEQVASLLRQTAAAVGAAHRVGVIHRDLKPQNLFLVNSGGGFQVKVLDFGLAKSTAVDSGVTRTGTILGTPAYMSPEQVGGPDVDPRTDLYSLAVVGFEALTGQRLVPEGQLVTMLVAVTTTPAPPLSSLLRDVPAVVEEAFRKALSKEPAQRPPDLETWVASFADVLERMPAASAGWASPLPAATLARRPVFVRDLAPEERATVQQPAAPPPAAPRAAATAPGGAPTRPAAAAAPRPSSGKGPRFVPKEEVARGPLGVILRGEDSVDGRAVAMRRLIPEMLSGPGVAQAVLADLKTAAGISHPNLVKVIGFVEVDGHRCVVNEWVSGRNFAEAIKAGHKMNVKQVHNLGRVLMQLLGLVHGKGLVHGSVQPSNLMVAGGVVKLADLGLGRLAHAASLQGADGRLDYRPPENALDVAGDLYAAAAVMYHLLTGAHPKSQPQGAALPLPSRLAPGVSEAFDKLLLRCLHPKPQLRYATAAEVAAELNDMVRFV